MKMALMLLVIQFTSLQLFGQAPSSTAKVLHQGSASIGDNHVGVTVNLYALDMKAYATEILPAVHALIEERCAAPLIALLQRGRRSPPTDESEQVAVSDFALYERILDDFETTGERDIDGFVNWGDKQRTIRGILNSNIAPALVNFYCLIRTNSQIAKQNVSEEPFLSSLYAHSPWARSLFTFEVPAEGGSLEIPVGESTDVLSKYQVERLLREVQTDTCAQELPNCKRYDNLQNLLRIALSSEDVSIVMSVS